MKTETKLYCAALAAVASLVAGEANALSFTSWQSANTGNRNTGAAGNINLGFTQFNPSLGTLHDVEFQLGATGYATYRFTDLSGSPNTFRFVGNITVKIPDPTNPLNNLVVTVPGITDIQRTVAGFGVYQVPGWANPLLGLTGTNNSGLVDCSGACLTPSLATFFTGTGSVNLLSTGVIGYTFNSNNDSSALVISRWNATLQVRYSYNEPSNQIPEPLSLALMGIGLSGIGLTRYRKGS